MKSMKNLVIVLALVSLTACGPDNVRFDRQGDTTQQQVDEDTSSPDAGQEEDTDIGGIAPPDVGEDSGGPDAGDDTEDVANDTDDVSEPEDAGCTPACDGKECGDDGCGGVCGTCGKGEECTDGVCNPVPACEVDTDCNDGNPCTDDACVDGACVSTANTKSCNDGNPCTVDDTCKGGACEGATKSCDDGQANTDDVCNGANGECLHFPVDGAVCDDGNVCTENDVMVNGACVGQPISCTDGNPCTEDACDSVAGCKFTDNTKPCDDGSACTAADTCFGGSCHGNVVSCDDGNVCTTDTCNPASGCVFSNNALSCDDGNACTVGDKCQGGACQGTPKACDDGNSCTVDACNPAAGCTHTPAAMGTPCPGGTCQTGACVATPPAPTCGDGACNGAETCGSCPGDCGSCSNPTFPHPKGTTIVWCYSAPQPDWRGVAALGGTDSEEGWKSVADIVLDGQGCAVLVTDVSATTIFVDGVYVPIGKTSWEAAQWFAAGKPPKSISVNGKAQAVPAYQAWAPGKPAGYEAKP